MTYDPFNKPQLSPERLAELEEQRRGTAEAIDAEFRELSDRKRAWRARNELTRRRVAAEKQAAADAEQAKHEAKRKAAGEAQRAEVRAQVQAVTPGLTGAALEAAVDRILTDHAAANLDRALAEKRRQFQGF
jgi:hypothetical protein